MRPLQTISAEAEGRRQKSQGLGFGIGAVDVEPNPSIQSMFPDIKGFPSLKYVNHPKGKSLLITTGRERATTSCSGRRTPS